MASTCLRSRSDYPFLADATMVGDAPPAVAPFRSHSGRCLSRAGSCVPPPPCQQVWRAQSSGARKRIHRSRTTSSATIHAVPSIRCPHIDNRSRRASPRTHGRPAHAADAMPAGSGPAPMLGQRHRNSLSPVICGCTQRWRCPPPLSRRPRATDHVDANARADPHPESDQSNCLRNLAPIRSQQPDDNGTPRLSRST